MYWSVTHTFSKHFNAKCVATYKVGLVIVLYVCFSFLTCASYAASVENTQKSAVDENSNLFNYETFQKFQQKYPNHPDTEAVHLYVITNLLGLMSKNTFSVDQLTEATTIMQDFIERYPNNQAREPVLQMQSKLQKMLDGFLKKRSDLQKEKRQNDLKAAFSSIAMCLFIARLHLKKIGHPDRLINITSMIFAFFLVGLFGIVHIYPDVAISKGVLWLTETKI